MINKVWNNFTGWLEYLIVTRLGMEWVGPVMRLMFKSPILIYRLGLGGLVAKKIIFLVTTGRRA